MIFETPEAHFPPSSDAPKELKKSANTSPFEKYLSKEMSSMNKTLGASTDKGLFSAFKDNTTSSSSKILQSSSSAGAGFASSVAKKFGDILSSSINLSM